MIVGCMMWVDLEETEEKGYGNTYKVSKHLVNGAYWISSNSWFIQYCESNIVLFSNAPPLVIALQTLR